MLRWENETERKWKSRMKKLKLKHWNNVISWHRRGSWCNSHPYMQTTPKMMRENEKFYLVQNLFIAFKMIIIINAVHGAKHSMQNNNILLLWRQITLTALRSLRQLICSPRSFAAFIVRIYYFIAINEISLCSNSSADKLWIIIFLCVCV